MEGQGRRAPTCRMFSIKAGAARHEPDAGRAIGTNGVACARRAYSWMRWSSIWAVCNPSTPLSTWLTARRASRPSMNPSIRRTPFAAWTRMLFNAELACGSHPAASPVRRSRSGREFGRCQQDVIRRTANCQEATTNWSLSCSDVDQHRPVPPRNGPRAHASRLQGGRGLERYRRRVARLFGVDRRRSSRVR